MNQPRGPARMLSVFLMLRNPARLAVDGLIVLIVSILCTQIYYAIGPRTQPAEDTIVGRFIYIFQPHAVLSFLSSVAYSTGWVLVAVACARIIASRPAPNDTHSGPG